MNMSEYMASALVGGVIQTTFAAISFAGAGFLFSKINHNGYSAEMRRHNRALESLASAKEKYYENEIKHKDKIAELRSQLSDANADINSVNEALGTLREYTVNGRTFDRKPNIADFYKPSDEMKKYENVMSIVGGTAVGFLADKAIGMIF